MRPVVKRKKKGTPRLYKPHLRAVPGEAAPEDQSDPIKN